jgi:hypothetical protein
VIIKDHYQTVMCRSTILFLSSRWQIVFGSWDHLAHDVLAPTLGDPEQCMQVIIAVLLRQTAQ